MKFEKSENLTNTEDISDFDVLISFRMDGTIFNWNSVAERLFGYAPIEVVGQNVSMIFQKTYFDNPAAFIKDPDCEPVRYETVCKTKSGKKINLLFQAFAVKDELEIIQGVSLMGKDITAEKKADEKQAMLASIVSSSDDAIISKTLNGIITSWNKAATEIFGYTEKEAIGRSISIIIPEESLDEEELILENIRRGEKIDHFETIRRAKDGTEKLVSLTISPVRNKHGKIIGVSKIVQDISAKAIHEERRSRLAAIVTSSDDAIISKTLDGIITTWNQAATRMFGYTEEEAIGKHISLIIPKDRMDEEANIINNIRLGNKIDHFETIRVAKDGSERQLSITVSPIRNSKGKIIGASKIARDISMRVEAENKQKLYTQRLQDLNDYKDEFMAMASHELKTPLTVIMANLQILQEIMSADPRVKFVSKSMKQVNKLNELIFKILDVSKIHAGKLKFEFSDFDLYQLLKEITEHTLKSTSHPVHLEKQDERFWVKADKEKIEQVIVNILSNAVKYSDSNEDIFIDLKHDGENIVVRIADKGIGIPQSDLENVFQRFYRVSGPASSFSGSGIGLYISAEIIKSHGGKIWAESQLGKGSVFYFSIPASRS